MSLHVLNAIFIIHDYRMCPEITSICTLFILCCFSFIAFNSSLRLRTLWFSSIERLYPS